MLASELIVRALRLINIPGRGAVLSSEDQNEAFEALQELVDGDAVSKAFVPGIRRHFFLLQGSKAIYSYGPDQELDTNDFFDKAPIRLEDAYIREGSNIIQNEEVTSHSFDSSTGWTPTGAFVIANGKATSTGVGTLTQTLALTAKTYTVRFDCLIRANGFQITINQAGSPILDLQITGSGPQEHQITFTGGSSDIVFDTDDAADDLDILEVSILEAGKDRVSLPDAIGSDYKITLIDQRQYNRRFSKGTGGRPYELLYSRGYPNSEIRFDNSAITGDIMVLDVLVNRVALTTINSEVRVHDDAIRYLRYALADNVASEYGKALNSRQLTIMEEAFNRLAAGNLRYNVLGMDRALRDRPTFDINRGDP